MTVKFRDPISAKACIIVSGSGQLPELCSHTIQKMNGRYFEGRRVEATLYSGRQRFRRSGTADDNHALGNESEAEQKRLDNFAQWLITEGD
jgi:HIV Tat-specific factor 1